MICNSCGKNVPGEKKFCIFCGTKMGRVCSSCGADLEDEAVFCGDCGARSSLAADKKTMSVSEEMKSGFECDDEKSESFDDLFEELYESDDTESYDHLTASKESIVPANAVVIPREVAESNDIEIVNGYFSLHQGAKVFTFAEDVRFLADFLFCSVYINILAEDIYVPGNVKIVGRKSLAYKSIKNVHFAEGVSFINNAFDLDTESLNSDLKAIDRFETTNMEQRCHNPNPSYVTDRFLNGLKAFEKNGIKVTINSRSQFDPPKDAIVIPKDYVEKDWTYWYPNDCTKIIADNPYCCDFVIEPGTTRIGTFAFTLNAFILKKRICDCSIVLYLPDSIREIADYAFSETPITYINKIPESIEAIGEGAMDGIHCMRDCVFPTTLKKIDSVPQRSEVLVIPDSVDEICISHLYGENLKKVIISDNVVITSDSDRTNNSLRSPQLKEICLPNTIWCFGYLSQYNSFISKSDTEMLNNKYRSCSIDGLEKCSLLEYLTLPKSVKYVGTRSLWGCTSIKALKIPHDAVFFENTLNHYSDWYSSIIEKDDDNIEFEIDPYTKKKIQIIRY